jgi:hypothetical protein
MRNLHGPLNADWHSMPEGEGYFMQSNSVMRALRTFAALAWLAVLVTAAQSAQAQSPAPIGVWRGENSGDHIVVRADGSCSASGTVNVAGRCEWLPTSAGGILNLYYPMPLEPGRIGWSIIWINRNLIMVNGVERFHRRG